MAGRIVLAVVAALTIASCSGDNSFHGCFGTAVIVTVTIPVDAGTGTDADASSDGGSFNGRPGCNVSCQQYLETLRVGIEGATGAVCGQLTNSTAVACVPGGTSWCSDDTRDGSTGLQDQIREYLAASRPEIDGSAVSLNTCMCNAD